MKAAANFPGMQKNNIGLQAPMSKERGEQP
jgi:hypothetical protein